MDEDTERAVIGLGLQLMKVRHLGEGEESQQGNTHPRHDDGSAAWQRTGVPIVFEPAQSRISPLLIRIHRIQLPRDATG